MINRLVIFGLGLMGGSLSLALRETAAVKTVVGCSRSEENLQRAQELGLIDEYSLDPVEAVHGADMIVLCVPLGAMSDLIKQIAPHVSEHAVVTDVGSAKASVINAFESALGEVPKWFVPGHPIAGNEKSGVEAGFADLYKGRKVILTPLQQTDADAIACVDLMWRACGASVESMSVEHHDTVLAATSHLPHMLAFGLVDSLARMGDYDEIFRYAAGGFRDFTRIASSDPVMWRDICLNNRGALLDVMQQYTNDLAEIEQAIADGDGENLLTIFSRAKSARDEFCG